MNNNDYFHKKFGGKEMFLTLILLKMVKTKQNLRPFFFSLTKHTKTTTTKIKTFFFSLIIKENPNIRD